MSTYLDNNGTPLAAENTGTAANGGMFIRTQTNADGIAQIYLVPKLDNETDGRASGSVVYEAIKKHYKATGTFIFADVTAPDIDVTPTYPAGYFDHNTWKLDYSKIPGIEVPVTVPLADYAHDGDAVLTFINGTLADTLVVTPADSSANNNTKFAKVLGYSDYDGSNANKQNSLTFVLAQYGNARTGNITSFMGRATKAKTLRSPEHSRSRALRELPDLSTGRLFKTRSMSWCPWPQTTAGLPRRTT